MSSPAKPWEDQATHTGASAATTSSDNTPPIPAATYMDTGSTIQRPNNPYSNSPYSNPYSSGPYNSSYSGAYSGYNSPYNTPYSSPYNNPYNSYNSPYSSPYGGGFGGGFGSGYGQYGNQFNQHQQPGQDGSLLMHPLQTLSLLLSTFAHLTQLLDTTLFTTHSTLMAFTNLKEQYANLRRLLLGQSVGPMDSGTGGFDTTEFDVGAGQSKKSNKRRWWWIWILIAFGAPYAVQLLRRLLTFTARNQLPTLESSETASVPHTQNVPSSSSLPPKTRVEFARALYDFSATNPQHELSFKKGDIVAILAQPQGEWWRGKLKNGPVGFFPRAYVHVLDGKGVDVDLTQAPKAAAATHLNVMSGNEVSNVVGFDGESFKASQLNSTPVSAAVSDLEKQWNAREE